MMKRALLALVAAAALAAAGCGSQMQNRNCNTCLDGCAACGAGGGGRGLFNQERWGDGQLAERLRAGAHHGPPHIEGDFLTGLQAHHARRGPAPGVEGAVPTVTYPYYTVRGPRDFLLDAPMPLGY